MSNMDPTKNTTQITKKMSNMDPTKNTTQITKKMSNMDPTKNTTQHGYGNRSINLNKVVATFEKHIFLSQTDITRTGIISNSYNEMFEA
jgi:hypothetical protein